MTNLYSEGQDIHNPTSLKCAKRAIVRNVGCSTEVTGPPDAAAILGIFDRKTYDSAPYDGCHTDQNVSFRQYLEGFSKDELRPICIAAGCEMHGRAHFFIGGDVQKTTAAPNDPVFFLIHAEVDRLWAAWQDDNLKSGDPMRTVGHGNPGFPPEFREGEHGPGYVSIRGFHRELGNIHFYVEGESAPLFTNNETNNERLYGSHSRTPYTKDAFHERVVLGREAAVNPHRVGSKAAAWRSFSVPAHGSVVLRARLCSEVEPQPFESCDEILQQRKSEADAFYLAIQGPNMSDDHRAIQRQASAGLFWSMQFYHYDVDVWLKGDAITPPAARLRGRNKDFRHISIADVISMPDKWEYPRKNTPNVRSCYGKTNIDSRSVMNRVNLVHA